MKFLIQHNLMNEAQLLMVKEAVKNYPTVFIDLIPFSRELKSNEPLDSADFIPYGSTLLTNLGYSTYKWRGLHFDLTRFNYEEAIKNRSDMLNDDLIMPLSDAIDFLKNGQDVDIFIRPSEDLKQFSGQVIKAHECADWLKDATECDSSGSYKLDLTTKVVIGEPRNIKAEWRWFVIDGKIVGGSMYRRNGRLYSKRELDTATIDEAQQLANIWLPDSCCVMDTALVGDELKVIEFNCINSSGFYDNDVAAIFKALWDFHN